MFENELFQVEIPATWDAHEHSDGAGADFISDGMRMTVTLFPAQLLRRLGINLESPLPGHALLGLAGIFSAGDGIELGKPEMVQLDEAEAVALSAIGPEETGELLIYEVQPGVLVFASSVTRSDQYANQADASRPVAASLQVNGTVDELIEAIGAPPPLDFATT